MEILGEFDDVVLMKVFVIYNNVIFVVLILYVVDIYGKDDEIVEIGCLDNV